MMISSVVVITRYYKGEQIKDIEVEGAFRVCGRDERCVQSLSGNPEGKKPLARRKHRWEYNIK